MKNLRNSIVILYFLTLCLVSMSIKAQEIKANNATTTQEKDESEVKAFIEEFLLAIGNDDQEKMKTMFLPNANIGSISKKDGEINIFTISIEEYLPQRAAKENRKFEEPVREYAVNISQGLLAFVRADATVYYDGKADHYTQDFFTLMKGKDGWKFLSASYTTSTLD